MSSSKLFVQNVFLKVLFAALISIFAFSSCGGGGVPNPAAPEPPPLSSITLKASPASIASGSTATIDWEARVSCNLSGAVDGGSGGLVGSTGSFTTPPLFTSTQYALNCGGSVKTVIVNIGSGCTTDGSIGAISLVNTTSRLTGVAPLSVFFDTTGTTTTPATPSPFHDLEYRWDFGDKIVGVQNLSPPTIGTATWNTGSKPGVGSRNTSTGPLAAHVYETPGTYYVSLTIIDGTNKVTNSCTPIVVLDPDAVFSGTKTTCVAAASTPVAGVGGCPALAAVALQPSFSAAINSYAKTGNRLLFKRGDTFTATTTSSITTTGPGIVGAYGDTALALPIIQSSAGSTLRFSSQSTPNSKFNLKDWRVMDLDFVGSGTASQAAVEMYGGINQVTMLRLTISNYLNAIGSSDSLLDWWNTTSQSGHAIWDQHSIVDSKISSPAVGNPANSNTWCYGTFLGGDRMFFAGNSINNSGTAVAGASHVTRFWYLGKSVINNNTLQQPGPSEHNIKLHAKRWQTAGVSNSGVGGGYSRWIVISDNKFEGAYNAWMVAVGPQDSGKDERVRDVIIEKNWYVTGPGTQVEQIIWAADVTVRNNIYYAGVQALGVNVGQRGIEPPSDGVRIYNNSYYSKSATPVNVINIESTATNVTVRNNLAYAPNSTSQSMVNNTSASKFSASNNSTISQMKSVLPFASADPVVPAGFNLSAGSYALSNGGSVPVWSDFYFNDRPQSGVPGTIDMGAVEVLP